MSCERKTGIQKRLSLIDGAVEEVSFKVVDFTYLRRFMPKPDNDIIKKYIKPSIEVEDILGR